MGSQIRSLRSALVVAFLLFGVPVGSGSKGAEPGPPAPPAREGRIIAGDPAPGFRLRENGSRKLTDLDSLRGKPVALVFGSCTCSIFRHAVPEIEAACARYKDRAHVYVVYIREAHPADGRPTADGDRLSAEASLRFVEARRRAQFYGSLLWVAFLVALCGGGLVVSFYYRSLGKRGVAVVAVLIGASLAAAVGGSLDPDAQETWTREQKPPFDPKTQDERDDAARYFADQFKVSTPILVDTIDNAVDAAYDAMPERIYVVDADGKIAFQGRPGPGGFRVADVAPVLDQLLDKKVCPEKSAK